MTTIADAMDQATAELRACRIAMDALRGLVTDQLAGKTTQAQTVINNFLNRSPVADYYVDANNGVDDASHGTSMAAPFKSLDYALDVRDQSVVCVVHLMTDDTLKRSHAGFNSVLVNGISPVPGPKGLAYTYAKRKLSVLAEATNSPQPGVGRIVPGLVLYNGMLQFYMVDIALPTLPSGIDQPYVFSFSGGDLSLDTSTITVDTAGSAVVLLQTTNGEQAMISMVNTVFGSNAPGKIFAGVAAGANPKSLFQYNTNITSA